MITGIAPQKIFKLGSIIWDIMTDKFYSAVNPPLGTPLLQQMTQGPEYYIAHMEVGTQRSTTMQNTQSYSGVWPQNTIW